MTFKRYSSIDNHYQTKELMRWLGEHPQLEAEKFVLKDELKQIYNVGHKIVPLLKARL